MLTADELERYARHIVLREVGGPGQAALGRARVNVMAIAQGSSELNISLVVHESDRERAVLAIHDEFRRG